MVIQRLPIGLHSQFTGKSYNLADKVSPNLVREASTPFIDYSSRQIAHVVKKITLVVVWASFSWIIARLTMLPSPLVSLTENAFLGFRRIELWVMPLIKFQKCWFYTTIFIKFETIYMKKWGRRQHTACDHVLLRFQYAARLYSTVLLPCTG